MSDELQVQARRRGVRVRAARSDDDARRAARWIYSTGPGFMKFILGPTRGEAQALEVIARGFALAKGAFSHAHCLWAEGDDGAPLGLALSFPGEHKERVYSENLTSYAGFFSPWEVPGVALRARRCEPFTAGIPRDALYLAHLGVDEAARGAGVGTALLEAVDARARARKLPRVHLHVSVDNPRAQALYERYGYTVVGEYGARELERRYGLDAQRGMVRALPT